MECVLTPQTDRNRQHVRCLAERRTYCPALSVCGVSTHSIDPPRRQRGTPGSMAGAVSGMCRRPPYPSKYSSLLTETS